MIKIKVKTLDSNNYDFDVDDNISVKDFKEQIASAVSIPADLQRLIFCGRVLDDEKLLKDYEINDGKVVHLVRRAPPGVSTGSRSGSAPTSAQSSPRHSHRRRPMGGVGGGRVGADDNSYLLGAFSIPQEAFSPNHFQQMLQTVISNMGDIGRNATVMSRTSEDGSSVDVQINLAQMPPQNECRQRISQANRFIGYINALIDVIERPNAIPNGVTAAVVNAADTNANVMNGFNIDANNMGSLEAQLAAQAAAQSFAAVTNGLGIPIVTGSQIIIQGPTITQSQSGSNTPRAPNPSPNTTGATNNTTNGNRTDGQSANATPVVASDVNQLLTTVFQTQERLRPHIQRLQQLMTTEGQLTERQVTEAQNLQRNCMRANHHLGHVFHLISDLAINWNTPNRTVGLIHTMSSQPLIGGSVPLSFATRQTTTRNGTQSTANQSTTPSTQSPTEPPVGTPPSAFAVPQQQPPTATPNPRVGLTLSGDQTTGAVFTQHSTPFVVMELGSTVHQIPFPTPTTTTASQSTNSTSNQQQNTQSAPSAPPPPPPPPPPSARPLFIPPFDPYLQCNSPFTIPEIRTQVSVGISTGRTSRQTNNNNNSNNNNNENPIDNQSANNPFPNLGQIVNGILSGFLNQASGGPLPPDAAAHNPNSTANAPTVGVNNVNVDPTLINLMSRLNNERSPPNDDLPNDQNPNMTDMFMSFVNGILGIISGGQTQAINVANFLNQLDGFSYVEGENIANDVFMVMARVLSFQDLFLIFAGNSEPLNRVRESLRQFVLTQILEGREPTDENIETAIASIISSWRTGVEVMTSGVGLESGIDIIATIERFLRLNLNRILRFFVFPPDVDYGNTFFTIIREFLIDLISLSQVCFTDGVLALQRIVAAFIEHMSSELNPEIQGWMSSVAVRHLNEYINNNNTEQSPNTESYIVRIDTQSSDEAIASEEHMNASNTTSDAENVEFSDARSEFEDTIHPNNNVHQIDTTYNELPSVVIGSEDWHSSVPNDWVPIITHDIERQRRLPAQRPVSDAYMNGMSKRRRIEKRPINLRDSLLTALSTAGVQPRVPTTGEQIVSEMSANAALNQSFDDLVRSCVGDRIVTDDDYINARIQNPERFTNSKNYFKNI
ncbi:unnamed protein product [Medioppia subpectinata]|uniref:Large proline-rich protein BAG6 n=1 Tax=Medioppia subpectinata TaxID=1979941 RepID=A0A7R9KR87_9ACAR|nr:unnamed protein product [Medioppia subpectinata]CAG2108343.1 unnamed protein product [Medioppia subpectinata]